MKNNENVPTRNKKVSTADIIKLVGLLVFLALLVVVFFLVLPYFEYLTTEAGREELKTMIRDAGVAGVAICFGLQFLQIVVAVIPGEITQVVIGAIYGPLLGALLIVLSATFSSAFIFLVVRKLGAPFVHGMIGSKHNKVLDFIREDRKLNVLVFILFLIPGLPKDVFTYLFPLTPIRPANFLILANLARIPAIVASTYFGSSVMQGDYVQAIIVMIIAGGLGLAGIIFNKQIIAQIDKIEDRLRKDRRRKEDVNEGGKLKSEEADKTLNH